MLEFVRDVGTEEYNTYLPEGVEVDFRHIKVFMFRLTNNICCVPLKDSVGRLGEEQLRLVYKDLIGKDEYLMLDVTKLPMALTFLSTMFPEGDDEFDDVVRNYTENRKDGEVPTVVINGESGFRGLKLLTE